jgi:hypothetical protein
MGLDQYAYVASRAGQHDDFYDGAYYEDKSKELINPIITKPREIAYWRKHPNLQGWMQKLYYSKGGTGDFNGDELELTFEDIQQLERDILDSNVAKLDTKGFFFGEASDDYYRDQDLEFVKQAKAELFCGLKVFYNSSW